MKSVQLAAFEESLKDVLLNYKKLLDSHELNFEIENAICREFSPLGRDIKTFLDTLNELEKKDDGMQAIFEKLPVEKQIVIIEKFRPQFKIYPISYLNDYVKNELHGNIIELLNSIEDTGWAPEDASFFVKDEKYGPLMFENNLDIYVEGEKDFPAFMKSHPELYKD